MVRCEIVVAKDGSKRSLVAEHLVFLAKRNREVICEFLPGQRYNSKVAYVAEEQQLYYRNKSIANGDVYNCYQDKCRRKLHHRNGKCFVAGYGLHDHPDQQKTYINLCALNEMKRIMRSADNRLRARKVFERVIKRYPKSDLVYERIQNTLRNHAYKEQEKESDEDVDATVEIVAPDTSTDTAQAAMVNDTVERVQGGETQNQSCDRNAKNESFDIEMIELRNDEKSIDFQDVCQVNIETTVDKMKPNPLSTYTCVDLISEVFKDAVEPKNETANNTLDSTCVRISKTANELRKTKKLTSNSSRIKVNLNQTPETVNKNWTLASPPQQQANKKFILENPSKTILQTRMTHFNTSDIFNESTESLTRSTVIERNSNGASTTSAHIVKTTNELRNKRNLKSSEPSIQEKTETEPTLAPLSHEQFMDGIADKNSTVCSSSQRANKRSHHDSSSTSTDGFVMMRVSEEDINRLIKSGHVCFVQGQFQYHDPNQE